MVWSCALALGLVWSMLTDSSMVQLCMVLALPGLALSMGHWKKCLPWIAVGWLWGTALQLVHQSQQRSNLNRGATEWVCPRPTFLSPVGSQRVKCGVKGIWDGIDAEGKRFRCWVTGDSLQELSMRSAFVRLRPITSSDPVATFDFASYLHSQGVVATAEVIEWGNTMPEPWPDETARRLSRAWRNALHRTFQGKGAPLIYGVFGGDKSTLARHHQLVFQHLGIAHLLAVSGCHVGLMSALFLLTLKAQNRWLKRVSGLGVLSGFVFVAACGNPISGLRSAGMLAWVWLDMVAGKRGHPWEALGIMASVTSAMDVQQPHMLGPQLSFVATDSLLSLRGKGIWWRVPIRAQMGTLMMTTRAFDVFPWLFYPINVLAGPAMLILGVLCLGGLAGLPCLDLAANVFASTMLDLAHGLATSLEPTLSNRWFKGRMGLLLVLPLSLHWLIQRIEDRLHRAVVWFAVCFTGGLGCLLVAWVEVECAKVHWHHLRGKPGAWLVTDGFGALTWSHEHNEAGCRRAAQALRLEGPMQWHCWNDVKAASNKQWTQPPFAVWVHRNQFNARTRPVHCLDSLNSVSTNW